MKKTQAKKTQAQQVADLFSDIQRNVELEEYLKKIQLSEKLPDAPNYAGLPNPPTHRVTLGRKTNSQKADEYIAKIQKENEFEEDLEKRLLNLKLPNAPHYASLPDAPTHRVTLGRKTNSQKADELIAKIQKEIDFERRVADLRNTRKLPPYELIFPDVPTGPISIKRKGGKTRRRSIKRKRSLVK